MARARSLARVAATFFFDAMQASYWRPQKVVSSGLDKDHQIGDDVARKQTEARDGKTADLVKEIDD